MIHRIGGVDYTISFCRLRKNRGDCSPPDGKHPMIRIDKRLVGEELLEVEVHELLHALFWILDERAIDQAAKDISRYLTRRGYRYAAPDE